MRGTVKFADGIRFGLHRNSLSGLVSSTRCAEKENVSLMAMSNGLMNDAWIGQTVDEGRIEPHRLEPLQMSATRQRSH